MARYVVFSAFASAGFLFLPHFAFPAFALAFATACFISSDPDVVEFEDHETDPRENFPAEKFEALN